MVYRPKKLDVDLWIDRTNRVKPQELILTYPETIRIGSSYIFKIENYRPRDLYEIHFSRGQWTFNQGFIYYTAPNDYFGPLKLTIKHTLAPFKTFAVFEDGTAYDEEGTVFEMEKTNDGKFFYDGLLINYEEEEKKGKTKIISSTLPTKRKNEEVIRLGDYSPSEIFGNLGSLKLNIALSKLKNNNLLDYYLPSEYSKTPDERKYLYRIKNGKFTAVPRNSNVTESGGNVLFGYRKPGEIGGSLTVYKGPDECYRIYEWNFEILLHDLEAILPNDIISICLTTLSITPVLRGIEFGHTYYWEQIAGDESSVTWLTPRNQKDVVIDLGDLKVDRVFRFWISRGTPYEKYYDVYVYGTPKEDFSPRPSANVLCLKRNNLNIIRHECSPIVLTYENIWNKQLRIRTIRSN